MPASEPVAVGEKVTLIVQEALAAILPPQLLVCPKLSLVAMPERVSVPLPVLVSLTVWVLLLVPTL